MAIFFFLVGLEIKRELVVGELSTAKQASLPVIAALGGMIVPALIYVAINWGDAVALRGWAIPAATDIAFAVGVLALLGPRIPAPLKIFLLALAIIDDLGAISSSRSSTRRNLSLAALALAGVGIAALALLNHRGVTAICALRADRHLHLGVRHGIGRARNARRRRDRARRAAGSGAGTFGEYARAARAGARPVGALRRAAAVRLRQCRRLARRHHARSRHQRHSHGHRARPAHRQADRHLRLLARRHSPAASPASRKARRGRRSSASPSSAASASR